MRRGTGRLSSWDIICSKCTRWLLSPPLNSVASITDRFYVTANAATNDRH